MDDTTALALNGFEEANLEPDDGVAAVCKVVLNRTALKYQSDGTIQGSIFWPNAFSWTSWEMVNGKYTKVAHTSQEVQARAVDLLARAQMYKTPWARAIRIACDVRDGHYSSTAFDKLTPHTVLYLNPRIVPKLPVWADPANLVVKIGNHEFFTDGSR